MSDDCRPILKLHTINGPIIKNASQRSNSIEQLNVPENNSTSKMRLHSRQLIMAKLAYQRLEIARRLMDSPQKQFANSGSSVHFEHLKGQTSRTAIQNSLLNQISQKVKNESIKRSLQILDTYPLKSYQNSTLHESQQRNDSLSIHTLTQSRPNTCQKAYTSLKIQRKKQNIFTNNNNNNQQ